MSAMLEALRQRQPLPQWAPPPADHRWPQVQPYGDARRPVWPAGLPGAGDEATWPAYSGHPSDPRRTAEDEDSDALVDAIDDIVDLVTLLRDEVSLARGWTDEAARITRDAIAALQSLEVEP